MNTNQGQRLRQWQMPWNANRPMSIQGTGDRGGIEQGLLLDNSQGTFNASNGATPVAGGNDYSKLATGLLGMASVMQSQQPEQPMMPLQPPSQQGMNFQRRQPQYFGYFKPRGLLG